MHIDRGKLLAAGLVSAALLGGLIFLARGTGFELDRVETALLPPLICAYLVVIAGRGLLYRALATGNARPGALPWMRLAARHQALFSLVPSGAGDIGFPYLSARATGLSTAESLRIIAQARLRDAAVLAALGTVGLIAEGLSLAPALAALAAMALLLWRVDDIATGLIGLLSDLAPGGRMAGFLRQALPATRLSSRRRLNATLLSLLVWFSAATALALSFRAAGHPLDFGETLLVLAMLNVVGALAVSIGGLGVSEAGAAGTLIALGLEPSAAAATALVARPLMLVAILTACGLLEFLAARIDGPPQLR